VKGNKCRIAHPLFGFYILTIVCLVSDILYCIFLVRIYDSWIFAILMLPATFKFLSGVEQIQMMLELVIQLDMEIKNHRESS